MSAATVIKLRSRLDRPGRSHTSPNTTFSVRSMSFGATLRTFSRAAATAGDGTVAIDPSLVVLLVSSTMSQDMKPGQWRHSVRGSSSITDGLGFCRNTARRALPYYVSFCDVNSAGGDRGSYSQVAQFTL